MTRMIHERMNPDALQARMERAGRKISALRARGICAHGWVQARMMDNGAGGGKYSATFAALRIGNVICLDCGETFSSDSAHHAARAAILNA